MHKPLTIIRIFGVDYTIDAELLEMSHLIRQVLYYVLFDHGYYAEVLRPKVEQFYQWEQKRLNAEVNVLIKNSIIDKDTEVAKLNMQIWRETNELSSDDIEWLEKYKPWFKDNNFAAFHITPQKLYEELRTTVRGQDEALRTVSLSVYIHLVRSGIIQNHAFKDAIDVFRPLALLLGETGSGKTHLLKAVASLLNLPILFVDSSRLVPTGIVGLTVEDVFGLLHQQFGNHKHYKRAIIVFDEFDKLNSGDTETSFNKYGLTVQRQLLSLFNSKSEKVSFRKNLSYHNESINVDTTKMLFILAGAFSGAQNIANKREGEIRLGFKRGETNSKVGGKIIKSDLLKYGFMPELVGRINDVVVLNKLTESDMSDILNNSSDSPLIALRKYFAIHNVDFRPSENELKAICREATESGFGARMLYDLLYQKYEVKMFEVKGIGDSYGLMNTQE